MKPKKGAMKYVYVSTQKINVKGETKRQNYSRAKKSQPRVEVSESPCIHIQRMFFFLEPLV